ncbi:MAG: thioredoxin-dependent thiol peroxidase [Flavobacteriia bacterium]|nr:thioredoxin-dependent thiol peroxidase [Flavobacteriia bacterium]
MIEVGSIIPNVNGLDQLGEMIHLADHKGKKTVIYFYPKDDTPGCTAQACNIRDNYNMLLENNIRIIGVSADSSSSHAKFAKKYDLPFPLIADTEKEIINAFGVWGEKKFMGKTYDGIHRTTFLANELGEIISIITKPKTKEHSEEIIELFNN